MIAVMLRALAVAALALLPVQLPNLDGTLVDPVSGAGRNESDGPAVRQHGLPHLEPVRAGRSPSS